MNDNAVRNARLECSCAASLNFVRRIGSARESLCRGLGSRWFTERFHRNALVIHFQHGQVCCTVRCLENYAIARCRLHQRASQRRHPTDVVAVEIDLVGAHNAHHSLRSRGIGIAHGRSEECPCRRLPRSRSFWVNYFRVLDSLCQKANPPIDLPQPPLAVLVVSVFTAIAIARGPGHHLCHGRAFSGEQKPVLIFEALQAARSYVVLASRRRLVTLRLSSKPSSHIVVFQREIRVPRSPSAAPTDCFTSSSRFLISLKCRRRRSELGITGAASLTFYDAFGRARPLAYGASCRMNRYPRSELIGLRAVGYPENDGQGDQC